MPNGSCRKDKDAAEIVRRLMVAEGLSPRTLSMAIRAKGVKAGYPLARVKVSSDSLYLLFKTGHIPGPRVKWSISFYFDLKPGQIWAADAIDWPTRTEVAA